MNFWLSYILVSFFTLDLVVAIFLIWVSKVPRTKSGTMCWGLGFLFDALSTIPNLLAPIHVLDRVINESLFYLCYLISILFMLAGSWAYLNTRNSLMPVVVVATTIYFIALYGSWWQQEFFMAAMVIAFPLGFVHIYIASLFFTHRHEVRNLTYYILSLMMLIQGIHLFDYPFLRPIEWFAPLGFLIIAITSMVMTITLAVFVLQNFFERTITAEKKAIELAFHDELTGLYNKRYLDNIFEQLMAQTIRSRKKLAILFLDLDKFKPINDTHGHDMGDRVLKEVAMRIRKRARKADITVRIGGDEFLVLLTDINSIEDVSSVVDKLKNEISRNINIEKRTYNIDVSIGVSIFPDDGHRLKELIRSADERMYQVKHQKKTGT